MNTLTTEHIQIGIILVSGTANIMFLILFSFFYKGVIKSLLELKNKIDNLITEKEVQVLIKTAILEHHEECRMKRRNDLD